MRVGLATIARGRAEHVRRQALALAGDVLRPERYVVVAMDPEPPVVPGAEVLHRPVADGAPVPLAAARNAAVGALADLDLAILLDADCLPEPGLVAAYADAARRVPARDGLLIGPVSYLPPLASGQDAPDATQRAAARPDPRGPAPEAAVAAEPRTELFWSLSFAVRPTVHAAVGGFDEGYVGYGAEDTDYGLRARLAGVPLWWVRDARVLHQHHGAPGPPADQAERIVANARRFHARWGWWPMRAWLEAAAAEGRLAWSPDEARAGPLPAQAVCGTH